MIFYRFKTGCCRLQMNICAQSTCQPISLSLLRDMPRKGVVKFTDHLNMTIAVDWDVKSQIKQKSTFGMP